MAFGMLSSGAQPIAIDFGVSALKALQIAPGDSPSIVAAAMMEVPEELRDEPLMRLEHQAQALPKLLRSAGFKGRRAVCSIPASHTLVQHMQVQRVEGVSLERLVGGQLQVQLACDPSQLVVRPIVVGDVNRGGVSKTEVICVAVSRTVVLRMVQALRSCKLDAVGVHSEHSAIVRAFDHITRRADDHNLTTVYIDIGSGSTKVAIAHGRDMVFAKTIQIAGRALDSVIARQLKIDMASARAHRLALTELAPIRAPSTAPETDEEDAPSGGLAALTAGMRMAEGGATMSAGGDSLSDSDAGGLDETDTAIEDRRTGRDPVGAAPLPLNAGSAPMAPAPQADLSETLESLTDEIAMCLRYHGALFPGRKVDRAIFIGGEAKHIPLCQHIARALRLPARIADPLAHIVKPESVARRGVDLSTSQPGWAVASGLGLSPADL